jgi:hypothetical protein
MRHSPARAVGSSSSPSLARPFAASFTRIRARSTLVLFTTISSPARRNDGRSRTVACVIERVPRSTTISRAASRGCAGSVATSDGSKS